MRASRDGHTFHERWTARRALQLVFPEDSLFAIAVEGLSTTEMANLGDEAEDIADLTLFFGSGDNFSTCASQQVLQFKYKASPKAVTASYLKKTIQKFALSLIDYEKQFPLDEVTSKLSYVFVTNAAFSENLWEAISCLKDGTQPKKTSSQDQYDYLKSWCQGKGVDPERLFSITEFHASTASLGGQNSKLLRTLSSWSPGADSLARARLHGLEELIREKAGTTGQRNNLVKREDVLDALGCDSEEDLFPAETEFVDVGTVVPRIALDEVRSKIDRGNKPLFIHADGGVGKTVFIQSLANRADATYETVIFDCFGGGSYRSEDLSRHLPKVGLLQILNELASRGLCDPQLPTDGDSDALVKAARKRLKQAASTIREQTCKKGILLIIDAADNAQLEANERKEKSFPRLLLASLSREHIEGVKLVLTARPHRMDSVIGTSEVERFELGTFTDEEAQEFLESRRENITKLEFSTAIARSGCNARVLEYLVESWDENVSGTSPKATITVEELIEQRCDKIDRDLHKAGWHQNEINQFFAAISLLPPPIPLEEMASALSWPKSKVKSAVTDLAPMLEVLKYGAIFRDEPTETFIREKYASEKQAQEEIADRLYACQKKSEYAAEALPGLLVVINDSDRAYKLTASEDFPESIQTEYGRRRLKLLRLQAAFSLAVAEQDNDRILKLTLELSQIASANAKGDQFIRRSPGVAVSLGDQDASRRLFQDRSGWHGARDARLTIASAFLGDLDEAEIHQDRAIGWINWYYRNRNDDDEYDRSGPSKSDFAAAVFQSIVMGRYASVDQNFVKWDFHFALSVCNRVLSLLEQYELLIGEPVLNDLAEFASTKACNSLALRISLLRSKRCISAEKLRSVSRAASTQINASGQKEIGSGYGIDHHRKLQSDMSGAALAALIHNSRRSACNIGALYRPDRLTQYDYGERHGRPRTWPLALSCCVTAWSKGQKLRFHHLVPREVAITGKLKTLSDVNKLDHYLENLVARSPKEKGKKPQYSSKYNRREVNDIVRGIQLIIQLAEPIQAAVLERRDIEQSDFETFLIKWKSELRTDVSWHAETAKDNLCRGVGFGFSCVFLEHGNNISKKDASILIEILNSSRFAIEQKIQIQNLLSKRKDLQDLAGQFAKDISEEIKRHEYIEQRGDHFSKLAEALVPLSRLEARQYFRQGLKQLDQMGGDDFDIVYSLLRYGAEQTGGWLKPEYGHRLMNICQSIFQHEPSKFGWTLFGSAIAQSVGIQAIYKLIRWSEQDVASFSYGLPQLACFLAEKKKFDARRAALLLLLCENEGWHDWKIGDGLNDLFAVTNKENQRTILKASSEKISLENPFGAPRYIYKSILELLEAFPDTFSDAEFNEFKQLRDTAGKREDEEYRRRNGHQNSFEFTRNEDREKEERETEEAFESIVQSCDIALPHSIDKAISLVREDRRFMFNPGKKIVERLRDTCHYDRRHEFISVLGDILELDFDDVAEVLIETVEYWSNSSNFLEEDRKSFTKDLFDVRGSELFSQPFSNILRGIKRLSEFCGDPEFVVSAVLNTVAKEKIELTGDEWLQLATSICHHASKEANLQAFEALLSSTSAQIGDEIGEGAYKEKFLPPENEEKIVSEVFWHLLGNSDSFLRWRTARCIKWLADLGLHSDISALLDCFDRTGISGLEAKEMISSSLNAQQWLLMGLARACKHHGSTMSYLKTKLEALVHREDLHAINKIQIVRCLRNISEESQSSSDISKLWDDITTPSKGCGLRGKWPKPKKSKYEFSFDYEFSKYEITGLARLFGISDAEAGDAVADVIKQRWPDAKDMNFFAGNIRYRRSQMDRYETFRESVQTHALITAATKLSKSMPVIRESYEAEDANPWLDWLKAYDVSFEDGSWLVDYKDAVPEQAKQRLCARENNLDVLESKDDILKKLGLLRDSGNQMLPLYASWRSNDGVSVRISSALTRRKGTIGRCTSLSRRDYHDVWLPTFDTDGHIRDHIRDTEFDPLLWLPERYPVGIDEGDEFATENAIMRPRLGLKLTKTLGLTHEFGEKTWRDERGCLALKSQVWGQWKADEDDYRVFQHDDGAILWASPDWLYGALTQLNLNLVFCVNLYKAKRHRSWDNDRSLRAVYISTLLQDGSMRIWNAKKASKITD